MGSVIRALLVYAFLLAVFRAAGKRTLSEATTFDLVLALIISEAVQQALIDTDSSVTNALLIVLTLVAADVALSLVKLRYGLLDRLLEGAPVRIVDEGRLLHDRMRRERVNVDDLREAARENGIDSLDDVRSATIERGGKITVVAKPGR